MDKTTRRQFLHRSGTLAAGAAIGSASRVAFAREVGDNAFRSRWSTALDRVWLGPDYWANPMRDWRVADGRIVCVKAARDRNVQLLTRQVGGKKAPFQMQATIGRVNGRLPEGKGTAGFSVGIQGPLDDYRSGLVRGRGLDAGLTSDGRLFIGNRGVDQAVSIPLNDAVQLRLRAEPKGERYRVELSAHDPQSNQTLGAVVHDSVAPERLTGNLALVSNFTQDPFKKWGDQKPKGVGQFWFADWQIAGPKVEAHPERAFGPIIFSQYTLSGDVMKMTAQLPVLGKDDEQTVRLQLTRGGDWSTVAEEEIDPDARTATFRIANWDGTQDTPYRLLYTLRGTEDAEEHEWRGTVRREPTDRDQLVVADISCNHHDAFPNGNYVSHMAKLDPDLLAFVGDQFYEGSGGYGIVRGPLNTAILDYMHHWYMHAMTWRELMRDRPSISIPDDHDVYQGNVWGASGVANEPGGFQTGGYRMDPRWVNMVHRTHTAHHPDPYDPTPVKQGISVYYGSMTYGGVSFAILADRQFKSGPEGTVPKTATRSDWITDPSYDTSATDVPEAVLLGDRQLRFLRDWTTDWRHAEMKAVVSQTIFTSMATHHGGRDHYLVADLDSNGWPQTPRNNALREIRKCFAMHLAGDQHLPAVVHYGIDEHRDAGVAFAGPAVNVGYIRWFHPKQPGENRAPGAPPNTGDFVDGFGHPLTVKAVRNPADSPAGPPLERMQERASGLGIVRFDKPARRISIECWPFLADPTRDPQCEGWPVQIDMLDNYGRERQALLPTLVVRGAAQPVIDVYAEPEQLLYSLRAPSATYQPAVFEGGRYTVHVRDPERGATRQLPNLMAKARQDEQIEVDLG